MSLIVRAKCETHPTDRFENVFRKFTATSIDSIIPLSICSINSSSSVSRQHLKYLHSWSKYNKTYAIGRSLMTIKIRPDNSKVSHISYISYFTYPLTIKTDNLVFAWKLIIGSNVYIRAVTIKPHMGILGLCECMQHRKVLGICPYVHYIDRFRIIFRPPVYFAVLYSTCRPQFLRPTMMFSYLF